MLGHRVYAGRMAITNETWEKHGMENTFVLNRTFYSIFFYDLLVALDLCKEGLGWSTARLGCV